MKETNNDIYIWNRVAIFATLCLLAIFYFSALYPYSLSGGLKRWFLYELSLLIGGGFIGIAFRALAHIGDEGEKSKKTLTQLWAVYLFLYPTIVIFLAPLVLYLFFQGGNSLFVRFSAEVSMGFLMGFLGYGILHKLTDKVL